MADLFETQGSAVAENARRGHPKSAEAFRTISEVAQELEVPQHVLRFWESRFPQVRPLKRAGGRRYYRPDDVALLRRIRQCLYDQGYTIKGVQKLLREGALKGDGPLPRAVATSVTAAAAIARNTKDNGGGNGKAALTELRRELIELRDLLRKRGR